MAQRQTIFGIVQRLEAAPAAGETLGTRGRAATTVHFEDGETAELAGADTRSESYRSILNDASEARIPVHVTVDGDTRAIAELRIPLPADTVRSVAEADAHTLEVELEVSHARHLLKRSNPDFERLRDALERARRNQTGVIVTETDDREIIDVREAARPFVLEQPSAALHERLAVSGISLSDAEKLFAMVSGKTCDAKNPKAPCITFLYPDDGCYARAHEMCRLIGTSKSGKVWNYGKLVAKTANHPSCKVEWKYHVAPTVPVSSGSKTTSYVLDPSLFTKPVSVATWKGVQGDAGAQTVETDAEPYYRAPDGNIIKDGDYSQTNTALANFRLALKTRSASSTGAPPYAACLVAASPVA